MTYFYLDTETTGFNRTIDKTVTIQFCELDESTGKPIDKLTILKSWEFQSEAKLLEEFVKWTEILEPMLKNDPYWRPENPFVFVPVGYNLKFDLQFLRARLRVNGLADIDFLDRPFIDLHPIGVLMNNGQFKGSGLDKLTGKPHDGSVIPEWYRQGNYEAIQQYIEKEASEFLKLLHHCYKELPGVLYRFKSAGVDVKALSPNPSP